MNTESGAVRESALEGQAHASATVSAARPLYWSVRRELWENRSIYVAPLVTAAVYLFGFSLSMVTLPRRMRALSTLEPAQQATAIIMPYSVAATLIMFTGFVVALVYCLDALYGERRDRSVLFWKSLPVSDRTTVLSKACIPLVVVPIVTASIALGTQILMLALNTAVLAASGVGASRLWNDLPLFQMSLTQPYGLAVHVLWHAPLYAWLLLVSAWARRTPFLWVVLPLAAIGVVEHLAFGTAYFGGMLGHRVIGAMSVAFTFEAERGHLITQVAQLTPGRFLSSGGLWIGLLFAAAFLAAASRLRRNRGPI